MSLKLRLDSLSPQAGRYFARQLEFIFAETLETKIPPRNAFRLFPLGTSIPAGAKTYTRRMWEPIGVAKIIANYADDLPRVSVAGEEDTYRIRTLGASYEWSLDDIEAAALANVPLTTDLTMAARIAMEQKHNDVFWFGDASHKLYGALSFPFTPRTAMPNAFIPATAADDIIADVFSLIDSVWILTKGLTRPTRIVYAQQLWSHITNTPRSTTSDTTIAQFIQNAYSDLMPGSPGLEQTFAHELNGAGAAGQHLIYCYVPNDPRTNAIEVPAGMVMEQRPPQEKNLAFMVPVRGKNGGYHSAYPLENVIGEVPLS